MVTKSISHRLRNPGMVRFPCNYQPTMVSTMVSKSTATILWMDKIMPLGWMKLYRAWGLLGHQKETWSPLESALKLASLEPGSLHFPCSFLLTATALPPSPAMLQSYFITAEFSGHVATIWPLAVSAYVADHLQQVPGIHLVHGMDRNRKPCL